MDLSLLSPLFSFYATLEDIMVKQDLINTSPVRFFNAVACGGLSAGQMGIITAKKGLGKTSVLVQFGIDALLYDKHLVHVSFDQKSSNVIAWYESVLAEMGKKKNIEDMNELSESIIRNRTILNFNQETFTLPKVVNTLKALKEGGVKVEALVIDGEDMDKVSVEDVESVSDFAKAEGIEVWFSGTNENAGLSKTVRPEILPFFDIVAHIGSDGKNVMLSVLKAGGKETSSAGVRLDAKTMLMCE